MANPNRTIFISPVDELGVNRRERPAKADGIMPGFLVEHVIDSTLQKCQPHSTYGDTTKPWVALEDTYQGRTVDDAYEEDDPVFMKKPEPGQVYMLKLKAGEDVTQYDPLISAGDGTVVKGHTLEFDSVAAGTVSNTTAATSLGSNLTFPKNSLRAGDEIEYRFAGNCPSTASTDTLTITVKLGSVTVQTLGPLDVANNAVFQGSGTIAIDTVGASGTFTASGQGQLANTIGSPTSFQAAGAANTTGDLKLDIVATWSAASTSDQAVLRQASIRMDQTGDGERTIAQADATLDLSAETEDDFIRSIMA